ncbi:helix-turn-helix transcriptional regulator [Rhodococcus sp. USK13]|uniref:MerR family transcriptional regulator n=1 Tax=Rhodococcus sp. USK13 TaxID=2806442 RepID=UPI001BCB05F3|nr:helix-turn-helix transcriptional regulator [Rhodococcus sp. USK13]
MPRKILPKSRRGLYGISVASELSGIAAQTLRFYEQYGLVTPARTSGGNRRYSDYDLARLQRVSELIEAGVNLAGIGRILDLERRTEKLQRDNTRLAADNAQLRAERTPTMDIDLSDAVPEADQLEQAQPADPTDAGSRSIADEQPVTSRSLWDAPEADRLEQQQSAAPVAELIPPTSGRWDAPEADAWEQAFAVPMDDDREVAEE